jgi:stage IV sporulation protein B
MDMKKFTAFTLCLLVLIGALTIPAGAARLVPVGRAVGINIECDGVIVVAAAKIETEAGLMSPAQEAGIRPGDIICAIGERSVHSAADLKSALAESGAERLSIHVIRGSAEKCFDVTPHMGQSGTPELGVWLRDGMAGIGTVTFIDPETGKFGALGHPVSDMDTGVTVPIRGGEIMSAAVSGLIRGTSGSPGQLQGTIEPENVLGKIEYNGESGIFGTAAEISALTTAAALETSGNIRTGQASIRCNVEGDRVKEYTVEIVRVYRDGRGDHRDMLLKVTDSELLEKTGGIVQGMSGSPIIQDGRLIGAVTHVLINDPTRGYGIAIENMMG